MSTVVEEFMIPSVQTDSLLKNSVAILSVLEMSQYWRLLRRIAEEFSQGKGHL